METRKIFLASSSELAEDRREFEIQINRQNKEWVKKGTFLELVVWEDFLDALSETRLQDEYNRAIRECDVFVMLFWTKVGPYTTEEFETAVGQFKATQKPFIYVYFKTASAGTPNPSDQQSLEAFKARLSALGHFYTRYATAEGLVLHFHQQLDKLAEKGFVQRTQPMREDDAPDGKSVAWETLTGSGTIAQGTGARAVGPGGVFVGGENTGNINTGTQGITTGGGAYVGGSVDTGGGHFVGRDKIDAPLTAADFDAIFSNLLAQIQAESPSQAQAAAVQVGALKAELVKGKQADDNKIGRLVNGLVDLVPKAAGAIVGMFATPILASAVGPVTTLVLDKLKGRA